MDHGQNFSIYDLIIELSRRFSLNNLVRCRHYAPSHLYSDFLKKNMKILSPKEFYLLKKILKIHPKTWPKTIAENPFLSWQFFSWFSPWDYYLLASTNRSYQPTYSRTLTNIRIIRDICLDFQKRNRWPLLFDKYFSISL